MTWVSVEPAVSGGGSISLWLMRCRDFGSPWAWCTGVSFRGPFVSVTAFIVSRGRRPAALAQRGEQAADLGVHVGRVVHRAGDLLAQQLAVALAQPVDGDGNGVVGQAQPGGGRGVGAGPVPGQV